MMTRRDFLGSVSAAPLASTLLKADAPDDVTRYVKPFIGTGGHGHTYPGATVPFGMVQLSPDTGTEGWDHCSGYHASDSSIMGFSHTHLSGTGIGDMLDILLMPGSGRSRFSHLDEVAEPGYYSVLLKDFGVRAELTATERAGLHRYTFPGSQNSHFTVDLAHASGSRPKILSAHLQIIGSDSIEGGRQTAIWADGRKIYFVMKFSRPFKRSEVSPNGRKCILRFETTPEEKVLVKVGISGVNIEGARKNLAAEIPAWDFDEVRRTAHDAWQKQLSRVKIETENRTHKEIFYTALYHAFVSPTLFDDIDGQYRGMDGRIHQVPPGFHNYSTFSLWDTYRAAHPLYTIVQADRVPDFVNCLIRMSHESPKGVPVWPLQAEETSCMTGYHSVVVVAEAAAKGFTGVDYENAYGPMRQRVMLDDYQGLNDYRKYGYIPCDLVAESVSKTLGYVYDDWAVAHIAKAAGAMDDHDLLLKRSKNYRNLFDPKTRFMRPRLQNGAWAEPFDPKEISVMKKWKDFTESNSWQETFANQHDVQAYIELFGGREAVVSKLDALFNQSSDLPPDTPPDVAGLIGMYAHGNEPSHHIAYLYCYAGQPWKTQAMVRRLLETMYRNQPDGMAGNEDCGQMSAWYVMSALGFYAVDPVSGNYVFGTPLFNSASIEIAPSRTLSITARRGSPSDQYIQSIALNGKPHNKTWFRHSDIAQGGTIVFEMGGMPNKHWFVTD